MKMLYYTKIKREQSYFNRTIVPYDCVAQFYIVPDGTIFADYAQPDVTVVADFRARPYHTVCHFAASSRQ